MRKPTFQVLTSLGLVSYLSTFLSKLLDVSSPLREVTTDQSKFTWAKKHDEALSTMQHLLVLNHSPVLKFYSIDEVTIQTDASDKGLGSVFLQGRQPVSFASRTLSDRLPGDSFCLQKVQPISGE